MKRIIVCQAQNQGMSPPLGTEREGALYHVTSRGNARQIIYKDYKTGIGFEISWVVTRRF